MRTIIRFLQFGLVLAAASAALALQAHPEGRDDRHRATEYRGHHRERVPVVVVVVAAPARPVVRYDYAQRRWAPPCHSRAPERVWVPVRSDYIPYREPVRAVEWYEPPQAYPDYYERSDGDWAWRNRHALGLGVAGAGVGAVIGNNSGNHRGGRGAIIGGAIGLIGGMVLDARPPGGR